MPRQKIPSYWAAVACGLGLLLFSTPARADDLGKLGQAAGHAFALLLVATGLNALFGLGIFVTALVLGRRSAPVAPWKRTVAVLGIVFASFCTAWNLLVGLIVLLVAGAVTSREPGGSEAALLMGAAIVLVPLLISVCAIIWSARLYGRNKRPPQLYQPVPYPPQYPPQQYG